MDKASGTYSTRVYSIEYLPFQICKTDVVYQFTKDYVATKRN